MIALVVVALSQSRLRALQRSPKMTFKQKTIHASPAIRPIPTVSLTLCVLCILAGAGLAKAEPPRKSIGNPASTLRLVGAPGLTDGHYDAAVEISMAPGSHTYWKNPGEAGVPPAFSFNGSTNVAKAEMKFPVPSRMSEEGLEAFGYTDRVVLPVAVTPNDPSRPSELHVEATYAVCNKICIPAQGGDTLALPRSGTGGGDALVSAALAEVPRPATPAEQADLQIERQPSGSGGPAWTLSWKGAPPLDDIFADAPEGFYFSTKSSGPQKWVLTADRSVLTKDATTVPVALILARKGQSLAATETLDLASVKK